MASSLTPLRTENSLHSAVVLLAVITGDLPWKIRYLVWLVLKHNTILQFGDIDSYVVSQPLLCLYFKFRTT